MLVARHDDDDDILDLTVTKIVNHWSIIRISKDDNLLVGLADQL